MSDKGVAAIVVLYNPDLLLLDRLLRSVIDQVQKVFIIDNTPESSPAFASFFNEYQGCISYLPQGDNKGIATAHNIGIRESLNAGYSHVLLLDQDSALSPGMVAVLLNAEKDLLQAGKEVAAVGPLFVDEKTGKRSFGIRRGRFIPNRISIEAHCHEPVQTDQLIASGALIRAASLNLIGLMKDELFIDWVDIEWCLRARSKGYNSYIIPDAIMRHSIGDDSARIFGVSVYIHNDLRNYYMIRNATYLLRSESMRGWRMVTALKIIKYVLFYSFYSTHRWKSAKLLWRAPWDGLHGRLGKFDQTTS